MEAAFGPWVRLCLTRHSISEGEEREWWARKPHTMQPLPVTRQTVLSAFQEVEDDLANLRYLAEEAGQQQDAVVAAEQALSLEIERYKAGTDSYLNVVTTQVIALSDEQNAITILQRRMTAAVDLIKALGGGWDASTLPSGRALRSISKADLNNTH